MNLLDLAEQYTELRKVSAGQFSGPCPGCGGNDRFCLWPDKGKSGTYWCRGCEAKGDLIQFCRDFLGMSFQDAARATGNHGLLSALPVRPKRESTDKTPSDSHDRAVWGQQADQMTQWCHRQLMRRPDLLAWLENVRGINTFTAEAWQIGFNPKVVNTSAHLWGFKADASDFRLPAGLVLPHRQPDGSITGIKIRQFRPGDNAPICPAKEPERRFVNVRGGGGRPWCLARGEAVTGPVIIVESELDALLLWQDLDLMATPVALLTAKAKPATLPPGPVLFALDFDDAGKDAWPWWRDQHKARPCPPATGKDISDMVRAGFDLCQWLQKNLAREQLIRPDVLNPYAHLSMLTGPNWADRGEIPAHLWETCRDLDGPVVRWQMACDDPAARRRIEREYQTLWGLL